MGVNSVCSFKCKDIICYIDNQDDVALEYAIKFIWVKFILYSKRFYS